MKPKTIINSLLFTIALLFFSCDNELMNESDDSNTSSLSKSVQIFTVTPTGVDDTQNIRDAFNDAKLAGEGNTVQLTAGTFIISEPIIVTDFEGTFKGAGKGNTILEDLPGSTFPLVSSGPMVGQPGFIIFYLENNDVGNLQISDMSINVKGVTSDWYMHNLLFNSHWGLRVHGKVTGIADFETSEVNVNVNNVNFIGEESTAYYPEGFNLDIALLIGGEFILEDDGTNFNYNYVKPISGNIKIANCMFNNNRLAADIPGTANANIIVGGSPKDKNIFDNVGGAISVWDESGSSIEVSYNRGINIKDWCVWTEQGYDAYYGGYLSGLGIPQPANFLIEHNDFSFGNLGIIISDVTNAFGDGKSLFEVVSKNKFTMTNPWSAGIFGWDSDEVLISNNRFYGVGGAGVVFGLWGGPGHDNWAMQGNNFNNFNAGIASIWLGSDSNNCTVIGGDNAVNVLDQGTNNILTGVNNQGNPPGPEIMAAMLAKRDLMRSMRN